MEPDPTARVRALCLAFPEVTERLSHGEPAWFVANGRQLAAVWHNHHGDGRIGLICPTPAGVQAQLVELDPRRFYRPAYVGAHGWLGVDLEVDVDWEEIAGVIREAYRMVAPKRLLAQLDATD
jgi:hypothetical protein